MCTGKLPTQYPSVQNRPILEAMVAQVILTEDTVQDQC